jgi:N,N'-diacetyllegionaminate synthase
MRIGNKLIDGRKQTFVIAEVAQAHDGSLGMAHAYVDAAAAAGADAIKFQTHIAAAESTLDEQFRVPMSGQDATRWHYWKRMEFSPAQWAGLAAHAEQCGLIFLSSPFSIAAVELLAGIGMQAWKVGSGEVFNERLLRAMAAAGGPILLSSGMSTYADIAHAVSAVRAHGAELALFQCASRYPTPLEQVGINVLGELRQRFDCPVGLSDHSGTPYPALAALGPGGGPDRSARDFRPWNVRSGREVVADLCRVGAGNRCQSRIRRHAQPSCGKGCRSGRTW